MGQQTSLFVRGTNSNHTLVLIDGVRLNQAGISGAADISQIHFHWFSVSNSFVDRVLRYTVRMQSVALLTLLRRVIKMARRSARVSVQTVIRTITAPRSRSWARTPR
jgi:hypothetical protein